MRNQLANSMRLVFLGFVVVCIAGCSGNEEQSSTNTGKSAEEESSASHPSASTEESGSESGGEDGFLEPQACERTADCLGEGKGNGDGESSSGSGGSNGGDDESLELFCVATYDSAKDPPHTGFVCVPNCIDPGDHSLVCADDAACCQEQGARCSSQGLCVVDDETGETGETGSL